MTKSSTSRIRWWPALVVLALATMGLFLIWGQENPRQSKVIGTMGLMIVTGLALFLWLFLLSRLSWGARGRALVGFFLLAALGLSLFDLRGFSGDLVPIFGWRFRSKVEGPPVAEQVDGAEVEQSWQDFPRFLGANGDGHLSGVELTTDWESSPPVEVWRREIGEGCSGFAVVGEFAVTQEQRDAEEFVVAYDLLTGAVRWAHGRETRYESGPGGVGPRTTPTIQEGRVFAYGATGILDCIALESGELIWSHDVAAENEATVPDWGYTSSPLLHNGLVVVACGGAGGGLIAYQVSDGALAWKAGDTPVGYASPVLATIEGVEQLLILQQVQLDAHDPSTGALLWSSPWGTETPNVANPVVTPEGDVIVASGYGVGAARVKVSRTEAGTWSAQELWTSRALKAKFSNFFLIDDALFGVDDGILVCVNAATGRRNWKDGRYGHAQMLHVGDHLLVLGEFGELLLIAADTEELRILASDSVLDGKTWNTPSLAAPYLLVRNDEEAACYRLPLASD